MAARHLTMRGEAIDMASLASKNLATPALGNANMNARGDILGPGGVVLKTQEQIEAEWAAEKAKRTAVSSGKKSNIKSTLEDITDSKDAKPVKQTDVDDIEFEPTDENKEDQAKVAVVVTPEPELPQTKTSRRRRIVDAE